ncbi:hypothetical protein [Anaerostipes hadrus]|uniref:Uncharacterized protein n=5 Tax=Anaerostipes hadrus TaxID=649756 RepID=A0A1Q2C4C6_ANAHA|nr:hypothetical protein [Anaerostipes hadrus]AQP38578.1 hypothetical protein DO83_02475 [Anaerostipes hadrus]
MATKTTNYGLTKPEGSDFYDIGVQNDNMDIIDKQMKANANDIAQLNSDLKDALVTQYAELNGTGNNYFYVDRKQGYRLSSAILHVYDTGYIRVEAISQEVNNENCYVLWTNNSYPQNKKIGCDLVWIKENFLWN